MQYRPRVCYDRLYNMLLVTIVVVGALEHASLTRSTSQNSSLGAVNIFTMHRGKIKGVGMHTIIVNQTTFLSIRIIYI